MEIFKYVLFPAVCEICWRYLFPKKGFLKFNMSLLASVTSSELWFILGMCTRDCPSEDTCSDEKVRCWVLLLSASLDLGCSCTMSNVAMLFADDCWLLKASELLVDWPVVTQSLSGERWVWLSNFSPTGSILEVWQFDPFSSAGSALRMVFCGASRGR